jgi:hypothetical protein
LNERIKLSYSSTMDPLAGFEEEDLKVGELV